MKKNNNIKTHINYLAYHWYLDQKYLKSDNNTIERVCFTCLNTGWLIKEEEMKRLIEKALIIANKKYGVKSFTINEK